MLDKAKDKVRWYYDLFIEFLPPELKEQAKEEIYISGGAIRSILLGETVKDIDLWFRSDKMVQAIKDLDLGFTTQNAVTFYIATTQYQIVFCQLKEPEDLIAEFDFTMNQNYYDGELVVKDIDAIMDKQLKVTNECRNPLGSLARVHKFVERGYKPPSKIDLLRLGVLISKKPVDTFLDLEDDSQLYFSEEEFNEIDFVEKPTLDDFVEVQETENSLTCSSSSGIYKKTRSGSTGGGDYL